MSRKPSGLEGFFFIEFRLNMHKYGNKYADYEFILVYLQKVC